MFKKLFFELIKPLGLIIGDDNIKIANNTFEHLVKSYDEVINVLWSDDGVIVMFESDTSIKRREEILHEFIKSLWNAFNEEAGITADNAFRFILKKLKRKYNLPDQLINH